MAKKGQVSLETLIVMVALVGALVAFAPSIGKISQLSKSALAQKQMEFAAGKIIAAVKEADMMGNGFARETSVFLPVEMKISSAGGKMTVGYEVAGNKRKIEVDAPKKLEIGMGGKGRAISGDVEITISNAQNTVRIKAGA